MTQDYGVAAIILEKDAYGIHQSGKWYTNENIDPTKRTEEDDKRFEVSLEKLIEKRISQK